MENNPELHSKLVQMLRGVGIEVVPVDRPDAIILTDDGEQEITSISRAFDSLRDAVNQIVARNIKRVYLLSVTTFDWPFPTSTKLPAESRCIIRGHFE